jgi:uncharacterized protein (TIGR02452 family)
MPGRNKAAEIARDTVEVVRAGRYATRAGETVHIGHLVRNSIDGTVSFPPDAALPRVVPSGKPTRFEVVNDTTLAVARRLAASHRVCALNFASARHPGGGFLNGARAQEESLCRASALYACINGNAMYRHHTHAGGIYSNYAIYSPAVPVFKDDDGELLDEPYPCAFVTAPAVNAGALRHDEDRRAVRREMAERVEKVLAVMAGQGHDAVVLGAWGCGVFKNDPEMIADLFAGELRGRFAGVFDVVAFAVLDSTADGSTIGPFADRFGGVTSPQE